MHDLGHLDGLEAVVSRLRPDHGGIRFSFPSVCLAREELSVLSLMGLFVKQESR